MKRFSLLLLVIVTGISLVQAQFVKLPKPIGFHQHDGFYLSMGLGTNFASISAIDFSGKNTYTGTGGQFDLKVGGAFRENLIFHGTLISNYMTGPKVKTDGSSIKTSNKVQMGESLIGGGFTYYQMPINAFVSVSAGIGGFSIINEDEDIDGSTDKGFSLQIKIGKEWWVSKNWGFGIGISYLTTNLTNKPTDQINEKINSDNFGMLFNTTFN